MSSLKVVSRSKKTTTEAKLCTTELAIIASRFPRTDEASTRREDDEHRLTLLTNVLLAAATMKHQHERNIKILRTVDNVAMSACRIA